MWWLVLPRYSYSWCAGVPARLWFIAPTSGQSRSGELAGVRTHASSASWLPLYSRGRSVIGMPSWCCIHLVVQRAWQAAVVTELVLVANGKGGVGKTSVSVNLAAAWAAGGYRVLVVDTDPQGKRRRTARTAEHDSGRGFHLAVIGGAPAAPITGVRDGLDLVAGGDELDSLNAALAAKQARNRDGALDAIVAALAATSAGIRPRSGRYGACGRCPDRRAHLGG